MNDYSGYRPFVQIATTAALLLLFDVGSDSLALGAVDRGEPDSKAVSAESLPESDQLEFANSLQNAAEEENVKSLNDLIDWSAIVDRATAGEKSPTLDKVRQEFKKGFLKDINGETNFSAQIAKAAQNGGSYKFLRLDKVGEEPFALFRLKNPNLGGINFHQFLLKRSEDGKVRANDLYIFATAERLSDTLRRVWLPLTVETNKNFVQRLTQPQDPLLTGLMSLPKLQKLVRDGQTAQALKMYRELPEEARKEKAFLLIRLAAAQRVSEEEHAEVIEDFRKYHPGDAALNFILIDGYFLKKDYESALGCIDRTNKNVGGDSCLLAMRANVLSLLDRSDEAEKTIEEAIQMEPDLPDNYFNGIEISLKTMNYNQTLKYITALESNFDVQFDDLKKIPVYSGFVKSPQYEKWIESKR